MASSEGTFLYSLFATPYSPSSDRIPIENIRGAVQLVERRFQRRHAVLGDRLRRPPFAAVDRAQGARLSHQENLVHAHRKDLSGDVAGGLAEQEGAQWRDLLRAHLLNFCHAGLFGLGFGRDRPDQPAPGEWRDTVGTDMKALHVERD